MSKPSAGVIAARSEAMSSVFLTADLGVHVIKVGDLGQLGDLDQLAILPSDDGKIQKILGVIVKGTAHPLPSVRDAEKHLNSWMKARSIRPHPAAPLPTIAVIFSMYDDRGYFAWRVEPIKEKSSARLRVNDRFTCQPTMGLAIQDVITRASDWYDEFFESVFLEH